MKKIRLIETFAGYGSQALALKRLGLCFENYRISEWNIYSNHTYYTLHNSSDKKDYSSKFSDTEIIKKLLDLHITFDDKNLVTEKILERKGMTWCRQTFNEFESNHNKGNICNITYNDINIEETDKYIYMLTYSFPCVDLSNSGQRKGMSKGSGTRSGLLWEIERLLNENVYNKKSLPQILFMENVKQVVSKRNVEDFKEWCHFLESLGYNNTYKVLNSKDFGIPQHRERCYMISILGNKSFEFPEGFALNTCLRDYLETNLDNINKNLYIDNEYTRKTLENNLIYAKQQYTSPSIDKIIVYGNYMRSGFDSSRIVAVNGLCPTVKENHNTVTAIITENKKVRKLSVKEFGRLMGLTEREIDIVLSVQSDTIARKQFGNSIVVNVMVNIFKELFSNKYIF